MTTTPRRSSRSRPSTSVRRVDAGDGTEPVTNEAASPAPTQSSPTPANDSAGPTSQDTTSSGTE